MSKPRPYKWNGVEYADIHEASEALDVSVDALYKRRKKGQTCDADLQHTRAIVWNGIEYASIQDAADVWTAGNRAAMHYRIQRGYTCDADMKFVIHTPDKEKLEEG